MKVSLRDASALTLGLEFALSVLFGLAVGYWLDRRLGTRPWLTLVGLAYGSAAGFRMVYRAAKRSAAAAERADAAEAEATRREAEYQHIRAERDLARPGATPSDTPAANPDPIAGVQPPASPSTAEGRDPNVTASVAAASAPSVDDTEAAR